MIAFQPILSPLAATLELPQTPLVTFCRLIHAVATHDPMMTLTSLPAHVICPACSDNVRNIPR